MPPAVPDEVAVPDPVTVVQDERLAIEFHYRARTPAEIDAVIRHKENPDETVAVFAFDKLSVSFDPRKWEELESALTRVDAKLDALLARSSLPLPTNPAPSDDPWAGLMPPINLNNATVEELVRLKGIGEARAASILTLRQAKGGLFESPFDLTTLRGITAAMVQEWIDAGQIDLSVFPQ